MGVVGIAKEEAAPDARVNREGVSATRTFLVRVSSRFDGPMLVQNAIGVPPFGHHYAFGGESFTLSVLTRKQSKLRNKKALIWEVTCEYETPNPQNQQNQQQNPSGNPLFDLPTVNTGSWSEYRDAVKDKDGNPLVNTANDLFSPHPKIEHKWPTLTIVRKEAITTPIITIQRTYSGKVNTQAFWEGTARQWKCVDITSALGSRNVEGIIYPYLEVTYQFQGRDAWELEQLDAGWNYLDLSGNKRGFMTREGTPYEGFLDGANGHPSATPQFITFKLEEEVDFNTLNLPRSYLEAVVI